jgi:Cft2 family RNA processing exonuclease
VRRVISWKKYSKKVEFHNKRGDKNNMRPENVNRDRPVTFSALAGGKTIGRHSLLLRIGKTNILFDPGVKNGDGNRTELHGLGHLNYIFLTHGHIDHVGALIEAMQLYPSAKVFSTPGTCDLILYIFKRLSYLNGAGVNERAVDYYLSRVKRVGYEEGISLARGVYARFREAGHILGSASVLVTAPEGNFLVTGDFATQHRGLLRPFRLPNVDLRALISEGSMVGLQVPSAERERSRFEAEIKRAVTEGQNVVVATDYFWVFQEYALMLPSLQEWGILPSFPIFLNEYLREAFELYLRYRASFDLVMKDEEVPAQAFGILNSVADMEEGPISGPFCYFVGPGSLKSSCPRELLRSLVRGGCKILIDSRFSPLQMWRRVRPDRRLDHSGAIVALWGSNHVTGPDLRSLILEARPKQTLVVHGEETRLRRFARDFKEGVWVPGIKEVINL